MTLIETIILILGEPVNEQQSNVLYIISGAITVICIMFFLKLFLLIGGFMSPKR